MTGKSKKDVKVAADNDDVAAEAVEEAVQTSPLEEAEKKAAEYLDMAKRIQADFDNYRKRSQKETEDFRRYANESLISEMLSIVDDLERALSQECSDEVFRSGVRGIHANLMKALEAKGLREIPTNGKFDPSLHDALCMCDGEENGKIVEVYQKGYYLGQRVLRHAKVLVTKVNDIKEGE